jgi:hypothetical protein
LEESARVNRKALEQAGLPRELANPVKTGFIHQRLVTQTGPALSLIRKGEQIATLLV